MRYAQKKQSGMVLVISLLILLVLTILGLGSMGTTTLEEHMATNTQSQTTAFQAAETAIVVSAANSAARIEAMNGDVTLAYALVDGVTSVATVTYLGTSVPTGYSLKAGGGGFVSNNFNNVAIGTADNLAAQANHTLGVAQIGPGG